MNRIRFATALVTISLAGAAFAQNQPSSQPSEERVNQLIVYGSDPCPAATDPNEITVCARKSEGERFRIPEALRQSSSPQNRAWNDRVLAYETVGRSGTLSCSATGSGGYTGCVSQMIKTAYAEKASDPNIRFSQLIADERAKRLSTIDTDAADMQARVEALEKEYEEREKARLGGGEAEPAGELPAPVRPQTTSQ